MPGAKMFASEKEDNMKKKIKTETISHSNNNVALEKPSHSGISCDQTLFIIVPDTISTNIIEINEKKISVTPF